MPLAAAALTAGLFLDYTTVPLAAALIALGVARWWLLGRQRPALIRLALVVLAALWLSRALWRPMRAAVDGLQHVTLLQARRRDDRRGLARRQRRRRAPARIVTIRIGIAAVILVRWLGARSASGVDCRGSCGSASPPRPPRSPLPQRHSSDQADSRDAAWPFVVDRGARGA